MPLATLKGHKKRVDVIRFHPTAGEVLATGSQDKTVRVWDSAAESEKYNYEFADMIFSIDWNYNGSLIVLTSRDKKVRIFDPRGNTIVQVSYPIHLPVALLILMILYIQN